MDGCFFFDRGISWFRVHDQENEYVGALTYATNLHVKKDRKGVSVTGR